jgi:hypothetical protein
LRSFTGALLATASGIKPACAPDLIHAQPHHAVAHGQLTQPIDCDSLATSWLLLNPEALMDLADRIERTAGDRLIGAGTAEMATVLTATLALSAACWGIAAWLMGGMDMGVATRPGSFWFFAAAWVTMMAAMMLPGAAPAVARHARARGRMLAALLFAASYLAVWTLVGIAVYALDWPHGSVAAGVLVIAAGIYELTPVKRGFRRRCREDAGSGLRFGLCCVGSSIALMGIQVVLGLMSLFWMAVIAVVACVQKLLPAKAAIDVPLALAIAGFGLVIVMAPSRVPGLTPPMM